MKENYKYGKTFKFKSLDAYVSTEWMADKQLKYRSVFDVKEINYLRFQFSFYNKLFDEEDWTGLFGIKVHDNKGKEICNLTKKLEIKKTQNVVSYKRGWGTGDYGGFWKEGNYTLSAFVDGELVQKKDFFVYKLGQVNQTYNPYFKVVHLKFFEGEDSVPEEMKYLKVFKRDSTKYIWIDFCIKNKFKKDWNNELFFYIFDDAGQLKAKLREQYLVDVDKNKNISFFTGWGNANGGSWKDDKYFVNVVFMDTLIASSSFEMGDKDIEGTPEMIIGQTKSLLQQEVEDVENKEKSLEELLANLNELIGLNQIKKKISEHLNYLDFLKLRKEKGFEEKKTISLHSVFTGNPGTGKTTVVKLLGEIYSQMGLLSKGHVNEVDRSVLVGEFIGQTAPKVKKAIDDARGGILFIDEAYALFRSKDDDKDFGREVIEILLKEMSDGPGDLAIMFAGYPKEMQVFLYSNPGLKSRITTYLNFPDYTPDELVDIAKYAAKKQDVKITDEALEIIRKILIDAYRNRDNSFGNARYAHALIDRAKMNMGVRIVSNKNYKKMTKDEISTITKEDALKLIKTKASNLVDIDIDETLLAESVDELNSLVGLENIKNNVFELIKLVRYYREIGKDVLNSFSMHAIFTGNPGTGKTTIARILGKIYKSLGLLERGHVIETDREGLIAGYTGQTAIKTKQMIDKSMGGILFIDEAYGLTQGNEHSYGSEAIEIILKNMEDKRGKFAVIAAGYPDNMDKFIKANPGLMSRFDKVLHFRDYSEKELFQIAKIMLSSYNLYFDKESREYIVDYIKELVHYRDKYFGNAREIRKIVEDIARRQNLRMADIEKEKRTAESIRSVIKNDVKHLILKKPKGKSIGFGA